MSIKFAVKGMACLLLGLSLSLSAQQTTPPSPPDSAGQSQSQSQPQSQTGDQTQTAPPTTTSADQTPSGQNQSPNSSQQNPDSNSNKTDNNKDQQPKTTGKVAGTSNDRLFYTLPNFLTLENGGKLPPLTVKEKFKVVALGTFDYVQYPWWGAIAAIGQADNSEPGYGQGWIGYAKRYGATAADSTIENFMVGAVFPSILHQDPRFYYSENGGIFKRTTYAISRIFVTRGDNGKKEFNFSEIVGAATAAAISTNTYHPKGTYISTPSNPHLFVASDRTLSNTAGVWATQVGLDTITLVVKEFWPDIHRKMAHRHMVKQSAGSSSNQQ